MTTEMWRKNHPAESLLVEECSKQLRLSQAGRKRGRNNPIYPSSPIFRSPWLLEASCQGSLSHAVHSSQPPGAQSKVESARSVGKGGIDQHMKIFKKYLLHYFSRCMKSLNILNDIKWLKQKTASHHVGKEFLHFTLELVTCRNR